MSKRSFKLDLLKTTLRYWWIKEPIKKSIVILMFISFVLFIILLIITTSLFFKIATLMLFLTGIQLLFLGIVSIYISKIHIESQDRPKYIVKETNIK